MGEGREGREGGAEESKLSQVRVLLSPTDPPPALGARTPLAVTPTHARSSRSSARRRATTSLPPQPPMGETTDEEQVAARQAVQRAATTAGGKQVRRLVAERRRNWSDPKKERRPTSPGNTATNDYLMNKRAAGPAILADIDFGDPQGPQPASRAETADQLLQVPRAYRPGYSESDATSDDSCYRPPRHHPRPPAAPRLSPSPNLFPSPLRSGSEALHSAASTVASTVASTRPSLAWDNYDSGPSFGPQDTLLVHPDRS